MRKLFYCILCLFINTLSFAQTEANINKKIAMDYMEAYGDYNYFIEQYNKLKNID
jgi:hypothetical protein